MSETFDGSSDVPNAERLGEFLMAVLEWVEKLPTPNLTPNPSPKGEGKKSTGYVSL